MPERHQAPNEFQPGGKVRSIITQKQLSWNFDATKHFYFINHELFVFW